MLILTTDTTHHTYFVKCLKEKFKDINVVCEEKKMVIKNNNVLDSNQTEYEKKKWFKNNIFSLKNIKNINFVKNVNNFEIKNFLESHELDLTLVFGTGILKKKFIDSVPGEILNFHGGNPELYRGLDSHLWTIYNEDFNNLVTSLHKIDYGIDTGDLLIKRKIPLRKNMNLKELRSINTQLCIEMAIDVITNKQKNLKLNFTKQKIKGKYYSTMPSELKELCIKKFKKYTSNLN